MQTRNGWQQRASISRHLREHVRDLFDRVQARPSVNVQLWNHLERPDFFDNEFTSMLEERFCELPSLVG